MCRAMTLTRHGEVKRRRWCEAASRVEATRRRRWYKAASPWSTVVAVSCDRRRVGRDVGRGVDVAWRRRYAAIVERCSGPAV